MIPPFHITLQISAVGLNQILSSAIEFDVYNRATNITYRTKKFWGGNIHKAQSQITIHQECVLSSSFSCASSSFSWEENGLSNFPPSLDWMER